MFAKRVSLFSGPVRQGRDPYGVGNCQSQSRAAFRDQDGSLNKKEQDRQGCAFITLQQWWEIDTGANRSSTISNIGLLLL